MTPAERIEARLRELARCTDEPGRITRLFLSPAHRHAAALIRSWMDDTGLATRLDASATLVGTRPGPRPDSPVLLLGSHFDTVRDAGRYDGCLGIVAAIEALSAAGPLPFAVQIRAFGDEEGVRFPVTLTGAHACAGRFDPAWLDARDADGIALGDALRAFGGDPSQLDTCRPHAFAYLELHIEQGPILEKNGAPLGVVSAINGATRSAVTVRGRAGHAGTVPMMLRQDALVAASAMIIAVRAAATARPGVVATVGCINARPGATNVIPGQVTFSIDLRAPEDGLRTDAQATIERALHAHAASERVEVAIARTHHAPSVACDPRLRQLLAGAIEAARLPVLHLPSGGGHDAMAIASLCPIGMLFVRCAGGISHHPDEAVATEDIAHAVAVLTTTLRTLDPSDFSR